ncbi:MAG TPA: thioesterase family protein [Acidimicrobiales bacterium]|nr:thioesterase family protein [Acidimicrobiales bacterium]
MTYSLDIEVRYGEVDLQGVVFNAHYLAWVDHCIDRWLRSVGVLGDGSEWDIMVKRATVEWHGSAGVGDVVTLSPHVSRWGNTSFDVTVDGSVEERLVFQATVVYVGVAIGTKTPSPAPEHIRAALSA